MVNQPRVTFSLPAGEAEGTAAGAEARSAAGPDLPGSGLGGRPATSSRPRGRRVLVSHRFGCVSLRSAPRSRAEVRRAEVR